MSKAVYLVGAPATGKSSTMAALMELLGLEVGELVEPRQDGQGNKNFKGQVLEDLVTGEERGLSLGVTRDGGFPGTDALGMGASPDAVWWVINAEMPELILGEGRRLGTASFLMPLACRVETLVVHLEAPKDVLDARCEARGSNQAESFRASGRTQAWNAADQLRAKAEVWSLDTSQVSPGQVARQIASWLG